ncbi:hypothetical protein RHGRI_002174 [Rhododendron griersonianum]|uniref:SAUR-like auxin-responsive protein family n=1 Tax=Rhododendron griersonianum TaxID=479676 RepID=A0AAV6LMW9_9ERIC|nr:hypothetical protein RHGRI_002174 [Rhododendron griersonianum]
MAVLGRKLISSLLNKIWKSRRCSTKKTMHNIAPKGSFFVYVGEEHKKYVVPILLSSSLSFKGLLEEHKEEMQASTGPLTLPSCSTSKFEAILIELHA